jgi:integrase
VPALLKVLEPLLDLSVERIDGITLGAALRRIEFAEHRANVHCAAAGLGPVRFDDLRHSAATLLLAQGVPQRVVMKQLGHSTLAMTQRYTHVLPSLMGDAAGRWTARSGRDVRPYRSRFRRCS